MSLLYSERSSELYSEVIVKGEASPRTASRNPYGDTIHEWSESEQSPPCSGEREKAEGLIEYHPSLLYRWGSSRISDQDLTVLNHYYTVPYGFKKIS